MLTRLKGLLKTKPFTELLQDRLKFSKSLPFRELNRNLQFKEVIQRAQENKSAWQYGFESAQVAQEVEYAKNFALLEEKEKIAKPIPQPLYFFKKTKFFSDLLYLSLFAIIVYISGLKSKLPFGLGSKEHLRVSENPQVRFSDVKGIDECREELEDLVDFLKNPSKYLSAGARCVKGVLLTGAPGTGKTLLARAIAGEAGVKFFYCSGSEFDEVFVGVGASRMRELFKTAREQAPSIIFIDELDAITTTRGNLNSFMQQTLNQLLIEIDGFSPTDNVVVIGATNFPQAIDPALKRSGRLEKEISVPLPNKKGRKEILDLYLASVIYDKDMDTDFIVKKTIGMTGASIANIVNIAATHAAKENRSSCGTLDFDYAIDRVIIGISRSNFTMTSEEIYKTAYHELGHALIHYFADLGEVHKITILPRGHSLGHTAYLPKKENELWTEQEMLWHVDTALGGRAAEEIFLGNKQITTGCSSDLAKATEIVYSGIKIGVFQDKHGLLSYKDIETLGKIQRQRVDDLASQIMSDSYERVKAKLVLHKSLIKKLAVELKEKETLTGEEFVSLIKKFSSYNMSDKDYKPFSKILEGQISEDDGSKYDLKNFGDTKKETRMQLKWKRIKGQLFGDAGVSKKFTQGVVMGAAVGGVAGTVFGFISYLQHRRLIYVPIVALSMAVSFGFFMGVGTVIRTDDSQFNMNTLNIVNGNVIVGPPEWQTKYKKVLV